MTFVAMGCELLAPVATLVRVGVIKDNVSVRVGFQLGLLGLKSLALKVRSLFVILV